MGLVDATLRVSEADMERTAAARAVIVVVADAAAHSPRAVSERAVKRAVCFGRLDTVGRGGVHFERAVAPPATMPSTLRAFVLMCEQPMTVLVV